MTISERINGAVEAIRARTDRVPELGLILGSGLGDFCDRLEDQTVIPFSDIPGFPLPTVEGHQGAFVLGSCRGRTVAALRGRIHYYEGYSVAEVGEILHLGQSAVKMRLKRGRELLKLESEGST